MLRLVPAIEATPAHWLNSEELHFQEGCFVFAVPLPLPY